ncbi:hypothetical protein ACQCVB_09685 [Fictibacillus phosphorivorans]|uniref:hypothetical protein n=1 Tax=Fictibacillus phosphorivorans TaxID=1221500 RepID=UPI003CF50B32
MKTVFQTIFLLFISLLLISCTTKTLQVKSNKNSLTEQTSFDFSHDHQTFQIIPLYEEVLDYTNLVEKTPSMNNKKEYNKTVVIPFQNKASKVKANIKSSYFNFFAPTSDSKKLADNTNKLLQNQKVINSYIKEALIKSAEQLPGTNKTIFIMPVNFRECKV